MALVLTGAFSFSVPLNGAPGRTAKIFRGQSVDHLDLTEGQRAHLKSLTVRGASRRVIPIFSELQAAPGASNRHKVGGKVSKESMKSQSEATHAAEAELAVKAEAPAEEAPKAEAPAEAKKAKKSKK